jgi:hypothetical protein
MQGQYSTAKLAHSVLRTDEKKLKVSTLIKHVIRLLLKEHTTLWLAKNA